MRKYCKAYPLRELRQFSNWSKQLKGSDAELADDTIVYLWDDFTVVKSPIVHEQDNLWQDVTPEWQEFCQKTLRFELPEDLRYSYEQRPRSDFNPSVVEQ